MPDLAQLRADLVAFVLAVLLLAIALLALGLALFRHSRPEARLISYAAFVGLYGLRLAAGTSWASAVLGFDPRVLAYVQTLATYWVTVAAVLFFLPVAGSRFDRVFRGLLVVLLAYAVVASLTDLWLGQPRAAMGPNTWLVLATQAIALAAFFGPGVRLDADLRIVRWSYIFLVVFVVNENLGGLGWPNVPGDRLLLFTDGLIEAANARDEFFGLERLEQSLVAGASLEAEMLADRLLADLERHRGVEGFEDDLTLLVADVLP